MTIGSWLASLEDCGIELLDVDCDVELLDVDCGVELFDEDCGAELLDEDCGAELLDEDCCVELLDEDCGVELLDEKELPDKGGVSSPESPRSDTVGTDISLDEDDEYPD